MEIRDKNYDIIHVGYHVEVPEPTSEDSWDFSFVGYVEKIDQHGYCIVVDGDGDAFPVEPERLEIYEEK